MSSPSPDGLSGMDQGVFTMLQQLAAAAANSRLVKGAYGNAATEAQCLMKLLYGHDLGISASAALIGIQIYDGQMEIGSRLLAGLVARHPTYGYEVKECTDRGCTLTFLRNGQPVEEITYDIEQATRAGLIGSDYYARHPEAMFFARAMSTMVARLCPDVTHGIPVYVEGEIRASAPIAAQAESATPAQPTGPAGAMVTAEDVAKITHAAKAAGLTDGELYNVIAVAAGGRGGVEPERAAERLGQVWTKMPQRYRDPVLQAIAAPVLVAAAQTECPAANNGDQPADPASNTTGASNGSAASEPRASQGDITRIRAVAAEMHVNDLDLFNLIAGVAGGRLCDDPERAAGELLPATFAAMPLRFVQPVLAKLRPQIAPETPPAGKRHGAADAGEQQPAPAPTPGATVSVAFSAMQPQAGPLGADEGDLQAPERQQAA